MLKAIQISGFVTQRWKARTSQGFPSISISSKPLSSFSPYPYFKLVSTRRARFTAFHASSSPSSSVHSAGNVRNIKFCQWCGGPTKHDVPDGEEKLRAICKICGKIAYQNPKMDATCWLFGNWGVGCGRCYQGNKGGSKRRCGSDFPLCSIGYSFNWPNLFDILSKAEEAPIFPWPRIIRMPTFSA